MRGWTAGALTLVLSFGPYAPALAKSEDKSPMVRYQRLQTALVETYLQTGSCWAAFDAYSKLSHGKEEHWRELTECLLRDVRNQQKGCDEYASNSWRARGYEHWQDVADFLDLWLDAAPEAHALFASKRKDWLERRMRVHSEHACSLERDLCFSKIKLAYDNLVLLGDDLELLDESCRSYIDTYDARYRRRP